MYNNFNNVIIREFHFDPVNGHVQIHIQFLSRDLNMVNIPQLTKRIVLFILINSCSNIDSGIIQGQFSFGHSYSFLSNKRKGMYGEYEK
jgi:hypothetical protein